MNWKQFKKEVEKQGVKDEDELFYLDLYPEEGVHCFKMNGFDAWAIQE